MILQTIYPLLKNKEISNPGYNCKTFPKDWVLFTACKETGRFMTTDDVHVAWIWKQWLLTLELCREQTNVIKHDCCLSHSHKNVFRCSFNSNTGFPHLLFWVFTWKYVISMAVFVYSAFTNSACVAVPLTSKMSYEQISHQCLWLKVILKVTRQT